MRPPHPAGLGRAARSGAPGPLPARARRVAREDNDRGGALGKEWEPRRRRLCRGEGLAVPDGVLGGPRPRRRSPVLLSPAQVLV